MWKVNSPRMHGLSEIGPNVPAFLIKLWKLVNSPETDDLICWTESGLSFVIKNPSQLSRKLLSLYYKHNNMASFVRQLNMYGFHKVVSDNGGLKSDDLKKYKDSMEFSHQYFIKGHPYLLENIKRKLPNPKTGVIPNDQLNNSNLKNGTQSEILAKVLSDVNNLKGKQESWDARLASMKKENEALWRELAIFRQKHLKQEQIINRLIHFIVTIVQPSRNTPLRRYPLMLHDIQPVKKITKLSGADTSQFNQGSPTGPTIHEIDTSDVIFETSGQPESSTTNVDFISSNLSSTPKFVEIEKPDISTVKGDSKVKPSIEVADNIPEDWLEIQLTEGNTIDPLTPVDPAKINPAVAAATLKHLEGNKKKNSTITITIPSVNSSDPKKKTTERRIIQLAPKNEEKPGRKNTKRRSIMEPMNLTKSRGSVICPSPSSSDSLFDLLSTKKESPKNFISKPVGKVVKRKASDLSPSSSLSVISSPTKAFKADTNQCIPDLEIDDLDFLLSSKKPDAEIAETEGSDKSNKSPEDSFLKLESLYNGTISEDALDVPSNENSLNLDVIKDENEGSDNSNGKLSSLIDSQELSSEKKGKPEEEPLNFEPDSMAVVCQNSNTSDYLTRELSSHVDSVQGEIDYLKEMLKGEGYSFDPNTLPWLFNDDPLSYGVMPPADEEGNEKKNEGTGVSGDELMAYNAPNLMDLVDLIGSAPSNQEWANALSPSSSIAMDLVTPAPSPSSFNFPNSKGRGKI